MCMRKPCYVVTAKNVLRYSVHSMYFYTYRRQYFTVNLQWTQKSLNLQKFNLGDLDFEVFIHTQCRHDQAYVKKTYLCK